MNPETTQLIKERFAELPQDVKNAILAVDLHPRLVKIAQNNHLHIDQAGTLETETMLVMLGLEKADDFTDNIRRELSISPDAAKKITAEANQDIFLPIRDSLKQVLAEEEEREEKSASPVEIENVEPIKKETLLKEIETLSTPQEPYIKKPLPQAPANLPVGNIAEAKLNDLFKMPREEKSLNPIEKVDPYREPTN